MQRPRTQFTTVDDVSIAYQVIGDGPIDVVYAHGWISNVEYAWESPHYARFLNNLGRFCRLIFFDRRGSGLSDREVGAPTLEQRTEDIRGVMNAVGSESAALFGVSEGGNMAAVFAATHPERTRALILYGSSAKGSRSADYPWQVRPEELDAQIQHLKANWGEPFAMDEAAPSMANDLAAREWFAAYLRFSATPKTMENISRLNAEIDIRGILPTIRVPTMVLVRKEDKWATVDESKYIAGLIPNADFRIIPGCDHLPWYGDQDRLIGEVEEFLTGQRELPSGEHVLLSVLMTDIVGSTKKAAELGDTHWRMLLDQHNAIVRRKVAAWGGEVVNSTGDGFVITFTGPTRAIQCAQEIQSDLLPHDLEIRAGVHTGECQRHGKELGGLAVHIAARVMSEAKGGSVLVTSTVKDLTVGSPLHMSLLGARQFKGIPDEWTIYQVENA